MSSKFENKQGSIILAFYTALIATFYFKNEAMSKTEITICVLIIVMCVIYIIRTFVKYYE
jgi:hypothetical protein